MKRIYLVVEGQTEQEFVCNVLSPYLSSKGVLSVTPILIRTSKTGRGGHVRFHHLLKTIKPLLVSNKNDFLVTTFIDYFRIPRNMPRYEECMANGNDNLKVAALEASMESEVNDYRFFPYIQLHEFEALLFANNNGFEEYFSSGQSDKTAAIISEFPNPEDINTAPDTAPSKRILAIDKGYDKVILGNLIAMDVGIDDMLLKCPRFSSWVSKLIELSKQ